MSITTFKPTRVKNEDDGDSEVIHRHTFTVKSSEKGADKYTIECQRASTVLTAIKSNVEFKKKLLGVSDENIIIRRGAGDMECTIATHFPCVLIKDECLVVMCKKEMVERIRHQNRSIDIEQEEQYSVFYIDIMAGQNAKKKKLFKSNALKNFKYVCVYGTFGMSVREALESDGRFNDDVIVNFDLIHIDKEQNKTKTHCSLTVDSLHQQKFKIDLQRNLEGRRDDKQQESPVAANEARCSRETRQSYEKKIKEAASFRGVSLKSVMKKSEEGNHGEIYKILRQQFPELQKRMRERFADSSYVNGLQLKKENFGKIQQSFSEVYRVRELLELGKSVCKIIVVNVRQGTGFVLFDNYILTNAHLFIKGNETKEVIKLDDVDVFAMFDYDDPEPRTDCCMFMCKKTDYIDINVEMDYAVLEIEHEGNRPNPQSGKKKQRTPVIPPGLLKKFGPVPESGEACIIGHPRGEVKKLDPTCIIEKEDRIKEINTHLGDYLDSFIAIRQVLQNQGIENIFCGGSRADQVVTYNTFMFHGSSGSPVFDCDCKVFALHSAGYVYGFPQHEESVIEVAYPLLSIFSQFVRNMKENNPSLYDAIKSEADGNKYLKREFEMEPMDTS